MVKTLLTIYTLCRQERCCILFPQWLSFTTRRQTISGITQAMQMILNGTIHAFIFNKCCCSYFDTEWNYQYGGNVDAWPACWTRNPSVPDSHSTLATCWICSRSSRVQIHGCALNQPTCCLLWGGGFNPVMFYLDSLFQNYLSGVLVNSCISWVHFPL